MIVEGLRFEVRDRIGWLTLCRPGRLNSLTFEIYAALRNRFADLQHDPSVAAVVITGEGRGFCSGGDLDQIIGQLMTYGAKEVTDFARMTGDVVRNMRRLKKPIIAAINGTAAGAGAVIALASDFRIAAKGAQIAFLFTRVGLSGADMGAAFLLPRVVGLGKATELLMLGQTVSAEDAKAIGLFHDVVAPEALEARAGELADRLARGPSFSLGMTKELLNNALALDLDTALDAEARAQTICMLAEDFKEFHASFAEKRAPVWTGR